MRNSASQRTTTTGSAGTQDPLVLAAVGGDKAALTVLLTRTQPALRDRIAREIPADLQGTIGVDDIVQQSLVGAFRDIKRFEPRGARAFERWLTTIALHALRNAIKSNRRKKRGGGRSPVQGAAADLNDSLVDLFDQVAAPVRTASRSIARREAALAMRSAMAKLPDDYRRALWGVCVENRPAAEVAAEMGRTVRAIHNLCHKGKLRLAELMGDDPRL
jgi:RNA polymerase sigma-70 factor (ECF subfamily)